jgi:serine/threonine protein kinase
MDPKLFGRYQIVRKLAGGGMGRVFLAYDPVLNRQVGLKLIDAGGDRDSLDVIAAERRGATLQDQLAKRESSGRVAQIFDVGEREGYFYIAMEYIEGEDLWELMARGPLPPDRAVGIALDILDVMVKAHSFQTVIDGRPHRGIIHGDIKPRNIRITPAGQVKVLDFGIAKAVSMTRSITFNQFGSVPYSSPERLQTGDMDARSDVWSMAIVLFEMLTGKPYFEAEASSKLEWMIRNYKTLQPSIAGMQPGLREILSRALDPDMNRRFPSAAAFESALHEWQRYAVPGPKPSTADLQATRRTVYSNPDEHTRRGGRPGENSPPRAIVLPAAARPATRLSGSPVRLPKTAARIVAGLVVTTFFAGVFITVYQVRMYRNASALSRRIDSGQLSLEDGASAYRALAEKSWFSMPLYPARNSLRERYVAEADRVLLDYREASESTPVYLQDWQRANAALNAALNFASDDKSVRGKSQLVRGYINLLHRDPKTRKADRLKFARGDFEAARALMPHSPDPHLGLAQIFMYDGDLEQAENELNESQRDGFQPGRREKRALADTYRRRGERFLSEAHRVHDITKMQDSLQKADSDLSHAQTLYTQIRPFLDGGTLAEAVSNEREQAEKTLEASKLAMDGPKENP